MFEFIAAIFNVLLYKPLFNLLVLLYNNVPGHDFGMAIILLTFIIRIILLPISIKATNSERSLQRIQPKIKEVQDKYKNDKERQAREVLDIYKQEKINPFSGLLLAFIQLPILIALYRVFWQGLNPGELINLYGFVFSPGKINAIFLGVIDLSKANFYLAILAGITQFFQTKMLLPKADKTKSKESEFSDLMQKQMTYFLPVFTVMILLGLPSALGLYWTVSGLFSVAQQYFILKDKKQ
jgi:YidC/Oxa1 family membrane protein insertase